MGRGKKCCATGCRSNYDDELEYTTVFTFPKDPERKVLWTRKISRDNFTPSSTAVVCIKHFEDRFIIREDRVLRKDGTELVVPRDKITLTKDAFPTIFENLPTYFSTALPPKRKLPEERHSEVIQRDEQNFKKWCQEDEIPSFAQLAEKSQCKTTGNWTILVRSNYILYFILQETGIPEITVCFKVLENLDVEIFYGQNVVDSNSFKWLLGTDLKCDKWSKLDNLLSHLASHKNTDITLSDSLYCIKDTLERCISMENTEDEKLLKLIFMKNQVELLSQKQLRYSTELIRWSSKLYFSFPAAYILIRDSKWITMPHPSYLRKLTTLCSPTYSSSSHFSYLKNKVKLLNEHEKTVNCLLDEIYINPSYTYKSGRLFGVAENSNAAATTVQAFMVSSITSDNRDIVGLFPVRNLKSDKLLEVTQQVLKMLHECGFKVLSLISDNNAVNRNMFASMCGGQLKPYIINPYDIELKLFFLFDTVHLLKSIRNNWLKQNCLYLRCPRDGNILRADVKHLKAIHQKELHSVAKMAPKLSNKSFFPNSIEKQNVKTVLNLFHDSNVVALEMDSKLSSDEGVLHTRQFIKLISEWWKFVNVKHPSKGKRLNDNPCFPIVSVNDDNFIFLQMFYVWVKEWLRLYNLKAEQKKKLGLPGRGGMLSKETFTALTHTTNTLVELVPYVLDSLRFKYILLGKFQTDNIEARFGQYRQMSGGNYNISCTQILESERKLRILSLLSLTSGKNGVFQLRNLNFLENTSSNDEQEVPEVFYQLYNSENDIDLSTEIMSVLIYISGYVAFKVSNSLSCPECVSILVKDKALELDCPKDVEKYLLLSDRGHLKWPQELLTFITGNTFQLFQKLISRKYESIFLDYPDHKSLLISLTLEKVEILGIDFSVICNGCGNGMLCIIKKCLSGIANIFLNNYTKIKNDSQHSSVKRKLTILANV